jgi:thiol-disulfide isomerase/thioredoxin
MPSDPGSLPEQEHSIKAREHELYAKPVRSGNTTKAKPFPVYLREIPAEPLAGTTKVMLWMVGAIVALLFLAAVWRVTQRQRPRSGAPATGSGVKTASLQMRRRLSIFRSTTVGSGHGPATYGWRRTRSTVGSLCSEPLSILLYGQRDKMTELEVPVTMTAFRLGLLGLLCAINISPSYAAVSTSGSQGADGPPQPEPRVLGPVGSLQSIHEDYARQLLAIERQRLQRLEQLAARQAPKDAAETYEHLFRLAITNNLFADAEPAAKQVLKSPETAPPVVQFLAQTVDIIASADRGDFDGSLAELRSLVEATSERRRSGKNAGMALDTPALLAICEAYHGRLIQGNRFDVARSACQLVLKESENPALKAFCARRLNQLNLIDQPAPAIEGTDLDGKKMSLAELKGQVVLVVFWASWCVPSSTEVAGLEQAYNTYQNRGFRIVGINLDTVPVDSPKLDIVMPNIRRFILDHNVRWPNLVNGTGAQDYAKAYGVSDIPTNVLISRDGKVVHLDLTAKNLETVVAQQVGR